LEEVVARTYKLDVRQEAASRIKRFGLGELLRIWGRMLPLYIKSPPARAFLKETLGGSRYLSKNVLEYMGYGLYVGRK
jgi:hypothetical protein